MAKNITMDELLTIIDSLPYNKFKEIIDHIIEHPEKDALFLYYCSKR